MPGTFTRKWDYRFLWPTFLLFLAGFVWAYYKAFSLGLTASFALGPEGPSLWAAQTMAIGGNIYPLGTLTHAPWVVNIYPPIYPAVVGWIFKISGPVLPLMRVVTMVSFVACLGVAWRIFSLSGMSRMAQMISFATFASFTTVWAHSFKGRPDMLALAFLLMSIQQYLVLSHKQRNASIMRLPRLIIIATLVCLACLTKQNSLVVVPAIAGALIIGRRWRLSLVFTSIATTLIVAAEMLTNRYSGGGFFDHVSFSAQAPFIWSALFQHLSWMGADLWLFTLTPVFIGGIFYKIFSDYLNNASGDRIEPHRHYLSAVVLAVFLFIIGSMQAIYAMGLECASTDDILISLFACAWIVGLVSEYFSRKYLIALFAFYLVGLYVMLSVASSTALGVSRNGLAREQLYNAPIGSFGNGGRCLSEDPALPIMYDLTPEFVDLRTFFAVWKRDPHYFRARLGEIKGKIVARQYRALILNSRDGCLIEPYRYWSEELIKSVKGRYRPVVELFEEDGYKDFYMPVQPSEHETHP